MGSLSVAYYTIAPISLDLLRPALLSETKKRGVVRLVGHDPTTYGLKGRCTTNLCYSLILPVQNPRPRKHLEPKGQATLAVISR